MIIFLLTVAGFGYYLWSAKKAVSSAGGKKSLAVLPFVNASQDPNAEYLSDGITESIINNLSQLSDLKVMSRNSAFRFKNDQSDTKNIASRLGAENLVTGDIKQIGDKFVINVRLINPSDDSQIWGNQYVKTTGDIITAQNEIALAVASHLRVVLNDAERRQLNKKPTENFEAYQLYLNGRFKITPPETSKAIAFFQQAIDIDPNYAPAYAGLASAYRTLTLAGDAPPNEMMPKAKAAATRAVEIDDQSAEGYASLGTIAFFYEWNWSEAEKNFLRALELNPNNADAHFYYAHLLSNLARHEEALAEANRAIELDPLELRFNSLKGQFLFYAGKYDEAIAQLEKTVDLEPRYYNAALYLGQACEQKKMYSQAIATFQKGIEQSERTPKLLAALGHAYAVSGERGRANQILAELGEISKRRYVSPYLIAVVYLGLGDKDQTFAWLEKAYQDRPYFLIFMKVEPQFDSLLDDPRYKDLLRRMNLND